MCLMEHCIEREGELPRNKLLALVERVGKAEPTRGSPAMQGWRTHSNVDSTLKLKAASVHLHRSRSKRSTTFTAPSGSRCGATQHSKSDSRHWV